MLDKIVKAIEMQYLLNRIIHSSSDCYNFVVEEYIEILKKNDEDSIILYHFCTEDARWKNHQWVRILGITRQQKDDLVSIYTKIVRWNENDEENPKYFTFVNQSIKIDGKKYDINSHSDEIVEIVYKEHEMEFEQKYKQVREQIELDNINKEFE